ncbi:MAG: phosphoglucosamine mutase [Opitutae bacterium]|nr:phosphoglucosamine mutase [Opitutae bacterium]
MNSSSPKRLYFGTDGVRGPYGGATMNETFAWRLGAAAGWWLKAATGSAGRVVIGRDTRASGASLAQAVADGLAYAGGEVFSLDVLPTPAVALAVRKQQAALGVVITASHNPAADNGIKFFGPGGMKLTDAEEALIEQLMPAARMSPTVTPRPKLDGIADYLASAGKLLPAQLTGWKIVLDAANGAAAQTSSAALRKAGADLLCIGAEPDGTNINAGVGSEHPEKMCAAVKAHGARLGIAHDGDGDRCVLCDEAGSVLDGDELLTILALHALKHGRLASKTLVVTVQSNLGVDAAVTAAGGRVCRTPVGDRYVIERMLAEGANLGGESSGHVICSDVSPTGDGLVAALKVIGVMLATGQPLSVLRRALRKFPQQSLALQVKDKKPLESLPTLPAAIRAVEARLGTQGRVLVRYSGTEPKLRLLVEGPTGAIVQQAMDQLAAAARADLEVV